MKLIFCIFISLISQNLLAQKSHDELIQEFLKERKRMMEEVMKAFDDDAFFNDQIFDDQVFDQLRKGGLSGFPGMQGMESNVTIQEKIEKDGSIAIVITPKNKNIQLDIETTDAAIIIKSEVKVMEENESKQGSSKSFSSSRSSRSIAIPPGFKASSPVKEGDGIKIVLESTQDQKKNSSGKTPILKQPGDESI